VTEPVGTLTPNQLAAFNMARLRKAAGMSQEEFGAKMGGWSAASVSAAERSVTGNRVKKFDLDEAVRIAGIFGVAVEELLKPVPLCEQCSNQPPKGYTCNICGRRALPARLFRSWSQDGQGQ
jgi:transcriptional regulator with XRE-family HTH domain